MLFRAFALLVLAAALGISATYRARARRQTGTIPRQRESPALIVGRLLVAVPLLATLLAYFAWPAAIAWSFLDLPTWARISGIALGLCTLPLLLWVFRSIGANISETVLTKDSHQLVTHGPYRYIRHPLYTTGSLLLLSLGLMSTSAVLLGFSIAAPVLVLVFVVPAEERALIGVFGDAYRDYRSRTGALLPKFRRS